MKSNGNCALWRQIGCSIGANSSDECQPLLRDNTLHIGAELGSHLGSHAWHGDHNLILPERVREPSLKDGILTSVRGYTPY